MRKQSPSTPTVAVSTLALEMAKTWERVDRVDGWILIEDLLALSDLALTLIEQALEPLEPL